MPYMPIAMKLTWIMKDAMLKALIRLIRTKLAAATLAVTNSMPLPQIRPVWTQQKLII